MNKTWTFHHTFQMGSNYLNCMYSVFFCCYLHFPNDPYSLQFKEESPIKKMTKFSDVQRIGIKMFLWLDSGGAVRQNETWWVRAWSVAAGGGFRKKQTSDLAPYWVSGGGGEGGVWETQCGRRMTTEVEKTLIGFMCSGQEDRWTRAVTT